MTYSTWKLRKNGLKRVGINFLPASRVFNPDEIRILNGAEEANQIASKENIILDRNNSEFSLFSIDDAITGKSSNKYNKIYGSFLKEYKINQSQEEYSYQILVRGKVNSTYTENCSLIGSTCIDGSNTRCLPGKCLEAIIKFSEIEGNNSIIKGTLQKGSIFKEFFIKNKFLNSKKEELSDYYFSLYDDKEELIYSSDINKNFIKNLQGKIKLPFQLILKINGNENYIAEFIDSILIFLFRSTCSGPIERCKKERLELSEDIDLFKNELIKRVSLENFSSFLKEDIISGIDNLNTSVTLEQYSINCFSVMQNAFNCITYQVSSGFSLAKEAKFRGELRGRPIYSRLPSSNFGYNISSLEEEIIFVDNLDERFNLQNPGLGQLVVLKDRSEGYKYTPRLISSYEDRIRYGLPRNITDKYDLTQIYSPKDPNSWTKLTDEELPPLPVTEWLTSGADSLLIESKEKIDRFFNEYLNPDTCFSESLDWLAQHVGLNDSIYRTDYSDSLKRVLIKNALGWSDSALSFDVRFPNGEVKSYNTPKGEVLNSIPFNNQQWSSTEFTSKSIIKSNTISGSKSGEQVFSNKNNEGKILFEKILFPEIKKLINSDGFFLELDSSLTEDYSYTLVRFYGDILPSFIKEAEKYFLKGVGENKYELYSEFGNKIFIEEYFPESDIFVENLFKVNITDSVNFIYNKNIWEGIHQSKGSRIGLAFALSLPVTKKGSFVHSHVLEELSYSQSEDIFKVKSGLRINELESISPLLRPWEREYLQVGDERGSFSNQLIADASEVKEDNDSYNLVFRLPFYYNRNGRTWKYVLQVKENWLPASASSRIQYPYLASELWSVGDAFFELDVDG